jgi:hypothetical protein
LLPLIGRLPVTWQTFDMILASVQFGFQGPDSASQQERAGERGEFIPEWQKNIKGGRLFSSSGRVSPGMSKPERLRACDVRV